MSLLADSRRKQKFSVDPRGLNWSQDDSKFGQKMLEKFGWSQGKGLGATESGRIEHVKLSFKDDTRGIGFTKKHENNWIAHQDDFNDLLVSLNANHSQGGSQAQSKVQGLEQRSKTSKGRLHYQKFTKSKDLSVKKEEDFDCIFGRYKSKSAPVTPQTMSKDNSLQNSANNSDEEDAEAKKGETKDKKSSEHGVVTVSSLSVQDYFKQKMEQLKASRANQSAPCFLSMATDSQSLNSSQPMATEKLSQRSPSNSDEERKSKRNKKKKSKKSKEKSQSDNNDSQEDTGKPCKRKHMDATDDSSAEKAVTFFDKNNKADSESGNEEPQKKKRKKKKCGSSDVDMETGEAEPVPVSDESTDHHLSEKKKKKKRKSKNKEKADNMITDIVDTAADVIQNSAEQANKKKKKKKSKNKEKQDVEETQKCEMVATKSELQVEKNNNKKKSKGKEGDTKIFPGANWTAIQGYAGGVSLR